MTTDSDDLPSPSLPPPLIQLTVDVHFSVMSLVQSFVQVSCLMIYILVALAAKLIIFIVLFPTTALTVLLTLSFLVACCQEAEITEAKPDDIQIAALCDTTES
jgi:hypothetical protein